MVLDIAFFVIIVIVAVLGLVTNPIRGAIHTVLFIGLTYGVYFILITVAPGIISSFNLPVNDLVNDAIKSLTELNTMLVDLGKQSNFTPVLIDEIYLNVGTYDIVVNGVISIACFIISVILALLVSILFTYIIWVFIKKFALKNKDLYNGKKWIERLVGVGVNLVLGAVISISLFNPFFNALNKVNNNVTPVISSLKMEGSFKDELDALKENGATIKSLMGEGQSIIDEVNVYIEKGEEIGSEGSGYVLTYEDYKKELHKLKQMISTVEMTSSEREEAYRIARELDIIFENSDLEFEEFNKIYLEATQTIDGIKSQVEEAEQMINEYKDELTMLDNSMAQIEGFETTINNVYDQYFKYLNDFSFLTQSTLSNFLNFDLGYFTFYNKQELSFDFIFNGFLTQVDSVYNGNINQLDDVLKEINVKLADGIKEVQKYIDEYNASYEENMKKVNEAFDAYEEAHQVIDELYSELTAKMDRLRELVEG